MEGSALLSQSVELHAGVGSARNLPRLRGDGHTVSLVLPNIYLPRLHQGVCFVGDGHGNLRWRQG
jgi:hypothetical protein